MERLEVGSQNVFSGTANWPRNTKNLKQPPAKVGTVFTLGSKEHTVSAKTIWEQENWEPKRESWEAKGGEPAPLDRLELTNANKRLGTMILSHYDNTVFMPRMTSASHLLENSVDTLVSASVLFCSGTYTLVHTAYLFLLLSSFPSAGWYTRKSESSLWKRHNDRKRMQFGACGRKAPLSLLAWHDRQWSRRTSLRPGHLGQNRWCDCFCSNVCLAECCMFPKLFGKKNNKLWLMLLYISSFLFWDSLHACCDLGSSTLRSLFELLRCILYYWLLLDYCHRE